MAAFLVSTDLTLQAGQNYNYTTSDQYDGNKFLIMAFSEDGIHSAPSFFNYANVSVIDTPNAYYGVNIISVDTSSFWRGAVIENDGTLSITATGNYLGATDGAWGIRANSWFPSFINRGTFSVTSNAQAIGMEGWGYFPAPVGYLTSPDSPPAVNNSGIISVKGADRAFGLYLPNGGPIVNSGSILVEGPYAYGISEAAHGSGTILNTSSGLIQAKSNTAGAPSTAIAFFGNGSTGDQHMIITNLGTIRGDSAIHEVTSGNSIDALSAQEVDNSGLIDGTIELGFGDDLLVNTGTVTGTVTMGSGDDVVIGLGGKFMGIVDGGSGNDFLVGGIGVDTLIGGDGNDILVGSTGADQLTGGAGANRFVYLSTADSTAGATDTITDFKTGVDVIDLSALGLSAVSLSSTGGSSTIKGTGAAAQFVLKVTGAVTESDIIRNGPAFSQTGTDGNDRLIAPGTGGQLSGLAGNDLLIGGGAGNDTLNGGAGNDTIIGGSGIDRAVFAASRAQATITHNADGSVTVTSVVDGTDKVSGVEKFQFSDGVYSLTRFADPDSAPLVANFNPASGWTSQDKAPRHVADVNGDGYGDIVGFGQAGVLVSYGSASGAFSNVALAVANFGQASGWSSDNQFHRELADVNGDGRADIVGFGAAGTLVALAKADGTFGNPVLAAADFGTAQGWASQDGFARTVGDVNGDGKADLIGFGQAGTLVALGNGDGTFQTARLGVANFGVAQGWTSDTNFHRTVGDVNGDGKADLIGFGQAGVLVAVSNGDGTFGNITLALGDFGGAQGWASNDSFPRFVADVNGDHKADIVGFGAAGTLVAYGNGNGTFGAVSNDLANFSAAQGWTSDATFHREIADINHDGLPDIIGFGLAGVLAGADVGQFLI